MSYPRETVDVMATTSVRWGLIQISGQEWALMDAHVRDVIDRVSEPTRLYLCGYAAASQWLAGTTTRRPLGEGDAEPTTAEVETVRHLAADTTYTGPGALPRVNRHYAHGVWRMLAWATGVTARPPLRLPTS
jgi:hypothetical protein